jgi:4'-phosphopantetheinyl transferase
MCAIWQKPTGRPSIRDDQAHVWRASLAQPRSQVEALQDILSPDELVRANRFRFERDRWRFVVGRGFLRQILGTYLNVVPSQLEFIYQLSGKPELAGPGGQSPLRFNLSHSCDLVVYAVTLDRRIGIDIESVRRTVDVEAIAQRSFSPAEAQSLCSLPPEEQQAAFFTCWTRKEAYLKATGMGLSRPLDQFTVSTLPTEPARLLEVPLDPDEPQRWVLNDLPLGAGYAGAMAVEVGVRRIDYWEYLAESTLL